MSAGLGAALKLFGQTRLRLGLDAYTLRGFKWDALQLLEYAAKMKLDTIQLDINTYQSLEPAYVQKVKDSAARLGLVIDGSMGCICGTSSGWKPENRDPLQYLLTGIRTTKAVGATCMRVYVGGSAERAELDKHVESTLKVLRAARSEALDAGVKIAIENHGDFQAWELRQLIETAGKEYVAACMDSGNAVTVLEDPLTTIEVLGPYVVTTHIRDSVVFEHPRGAVTQWVALGDGVVDFKAFFARFRELCPQSGVQLEILTGNPPRIVPYLEPDFWKVFPKARASEFARFVKLARTGRPLMARMVTGDPSVPEYEAALRAQQKYDLERSFEYARQTLGIGTRA